MKPMHLAVVGAVVAVVAVLFFVMQGDDGGRGQRRSDSGDNRVRTPTKTDSDARETDGDAGSVRDGDLSLSLTVVAADGTPQLGAAVSLVGMRSRNVATDETGAAGFEGLAAGFYDLSARKGNAVVARSFELKKSMDLGELRLADAITIRGHVYDPQGAAVPGARVEAITSERTRGFDFSKIIEGWLKPDAVASATKTDAEGVYELVVQKGSSVALRVIASGYAQDSEPARAYHTDTTGINFHLFRGTIVAGVVVDPDGRPVAAARIMVSNPMAVFSRRTAKMETTSAADGRFSMSVTVAQQSMLTIRAVGYALHMDRVKGPATDMRVVLEPGVMLRLRTMDSDNPVPAPGVTVFLTYKGGFANGTTDDRGELVIAHLPTKSTGMMGGQQQAFMTGGGYIAKMISLADKKVVDGVVEVGDVKLKRGGTVRGRVLDSKTSEPVVGASVRTFGGLDMQLMMIGSIPTVSDKEGKFELTGVPLGATALIAQHRDYIMDLNPMSFMGMGMGGGGGGKSLFPDGVTEIEKDVTITRAAVVTGVVVDTKGNPVAGATVTVKAGQEGMMLAMLGGGTPEAVTNAEGKFSLVGLKEGKSAKLVASHREYGSSKAQSVSPGSGESVSLALADPIQLHGLVVDERGDPIEGVRVTAARKGTTNRRNPMAMVMPGSARPAVTDDKGEYTLRGAPAGALDVNLEHEGYRPKKLVVRTQAGTTLHEVDKATLERGPGIEGVVVDENGKPVPGVTVNANVSFSSRAVQPTTQQPTEGRQWANGITDKEGRFALWGLRDSKYSVQPYQGGSYGEQKTVRSGTRDLRLTLRPAAVLKGRVTANGVPVLGATVRTEMPGDGGNIAMRGMGYAQTDSDGEFTITPLPPDGTFTVVIEHNGYATRRVENVSAGGGVRDFILDQGVRIGGVVVDNKGNPVPRARLRVQAGKSSKNVRADQDGNFIAGGLGDGEIKIHITSWSGFVKRDPITVTPGDMNVRVVVERGESINGTITGAAPEQGEQQTIRVEAIAADGDSAATAWVWQQNREFRLQGLRPGTYTLRVSQLVEHKWKTLAEVTGVTSGSEGVEVSIE